MSRLTQFQHGLSHCQAVVVDMLVDDRVFLRKMVDAVHLLFRSHGKLMVGHHCTASQERMVLCVWHCQRYALYQSEENYARLRSSWADLGVRDRRELRKVVPLSESARNIALLGPSGPFRHVQHEHLPNTRGQEAHVTVRDFFLELTYIVFIWDPCCAQTLPPHCFVSV